MVKTPSKTRARSQSPNTNLQRSSHAVSDSRKAEQSKKDSARVSKLQASHSRLVGPETARRSARLRSQAPINYFPPRNTVREPVPRERGNYGLNVDAGWRNNVGQLQPREFNH